jgi:hypothetical protein
VEAWGAALFGQPCRECGFDWSLSPAHAVAVIAGAPAEVERRIQTAQGDERRAAGGWSVTEYVSHLADNLRNWAERVQAARLGEVNEVVGYDPDELARVRGYAAIPVQAAAWSLRISCGLWVPVMQAALADGVVLHHAMRGEQRAEDIARNNCHDLFHHLWDLDQILLAR